MTVTPNPDTVRRIADLQVGWHLVTNVAWELGGGDPNARRAVTQTLEELFAAGCLERMFVYCHGRPQAVYLLDGSLAVREEGER